MDFTTFIELVFGTAWIIFQVCWSVVIPVMAASLYAGLRGGGLSVWMLIAIFVGGFILIPVVGGREGGMVYMALPFVLPLYILPLFGIGQLLRRRKPKQIDRDIIEIR